MSIDDVELCGIDVFGSSRDGGPECDGCLNRLSRYAGRVPHVDGRGSAIAMVVGINRKWNEYSVSFQLARDASNVVNVEML